MKPVGYSRKSTKEQDDEYQRIQLRAFATREHVDMPLYAETMSTRKTRPVKAEIMRQFNSGLIDTIVVSRMDRFARSFIELVYDVEHIVARGGRFICLQQGFDWHGKMDATSRLQFGMFALFSEFEREMISERAAEGRARSRAQGKHQGRPPGIHTPWKKKTPPETLGPVELVSAAEKKV